MLPEDRYITIDHGEEPVSHSYFARIILSNMQDLHLDWWLNNVDGNLSAVWPQSAFRIPNLDLL